jgi:hypothetical protein
MRCMSHENVGSRSSQVGVDLFKTPVHKRSPGFPRREQLSQGGTGSIVKLMLPVKTGIFKGIMNTYALAGQYILIELALEWVPQPNQIQFSIDDNVSTVEADLNNNTTVTNAIIRAFETAKAHCLRQPP